MKKRITVIAICVVLAALVLVIVVNAQPSSSASSSRAIGAMSGGHYQLITASAPEAILASGGDYRLLSPSILVDPAAGCCCKTNLPCVRK